MVVFDDQITIRQLPATYMSADNWFDYLAERAISSRGLSLLAWHMLALFVGTIIGCITQPLPIAGVAIIGLTLGVLLGVTSMTDAMAGFGDNTVWMIAMAYFLSRGFVKTGLGRRVALVFVKLFAKDP